MTKHIPKPDINDPEKTSAYFNSLLARLTFEQLLKTSDKIDAIDHRVDGADEVQSAAYHLREMAMDNLALSGLVDFRQAALSAGALSHTLELLLAGGWHSEFAKAHAETRARLLLDDLVRFLMGWADVEPKDIGLDRYWTEEGSLMGRIDKAAGAPAPTD